MTSPTQDTPAAPASWRDTFGWPLGVVGACAASAGAAFLYAQLRSSGYMVPFLVGVAAGFGARALSNKGGPLMAAIALLAALAGSIAGEWLGAPFRRDPSLGYFLTHLADLPPMTLALHALGAAVAAWIAWTAPRRDVPRA